MNRKQIIRMAEKCGIPEFENNESQAENIMRFAALVAQRERDELTVMFLEAHEGAKDNHNYWHVAANKIKEKQ